MKKPGRMKKFNSHRFFPLHIAHIIRRSSKLFQHNVVICVDTNIGSDI